MSYRSGILDFCGSEVLTRFDIDEPDGKMCFMNFENGSYSKEEVFEGIKTIHPNILKGVIIGKKSWGLWKNEWSDGISECLFSLTEITQQFTDKNIIIPKSLMIDFENTIYRKKKKKFEDYFKEKQLKQTK